MKIPGTVWIVALVALPLLSEWLTQYFPNAQWAAPVAALLLIAAKVVQVVRDSGASDSALEVMCEAKPESKTKQILLG